MLPKLNAKDRAVNPQKKSLHRCKTWLSTGATGLEFFQRFFNDFPVVSSATHQHCKGKPLHHLPAVESNQGGVPVAIHTD